VLQFPDSPRGISCRIRRRFVLAFDKECGCRFFGLVERALHASRAVWTLVKEVIRAVAVAQVVILPRSVSGKAIADGLLLDKHFERAQVPFEVPCGVVALREFRGSL
jgi:hypothetical protein